MGTKRVEDLTPAELTEIRFASSALERRRHTLQRERALHEATMHWTLNALIKKTMAQKIEEIDKEILKTMRKISDAH